MNVSTITKISSNLYVDKLESQRKFYSKPQENTNTNQTDTVEISFKMAQKVANVVKKPKWDVFQQAKYELGRYVQSGKQLPNQAEKWLKPLREALGADKTVVKNPDNLKEILKIDSKLTVDKINKENGVKALFDALNTMIAATLYKPVQKNIGGIDYVIHNKNIANLLRSNYSQREFNKLRNYLNEHHLFDMSDNNNYGLVIDKQRNIAKTCGAAENWEMSDRAWLTDTFRVGDIQKFERPETWVPALNTVGDYYETQIDAFKKLIANPELYREGDVMQGIPHIFLPATLGPDTEWFNNKRLESHGLALKEFSLGITDGIINRREYGYKSADAVPENVIVAMNNLSKYFKAIDYSTAPSAGNWEEVPLKGGLTNDTETIRSALNAYRDLLYNPKYDSNFEMIKVRERFNKLEPLSEKELKKMINDGEKRVRKTYLQEAPRIRPHDASLAFITTSDIKLADNIVDDVKKHIKILESLEKHLVKENGMNRYSPFEFGLKDGSKAKTPDSYLNLNYFVAVDKEGKLNLDWKKVLDKFGSKDCSEPEMFKARAELSTPDREAQWFMVSEMSTGYGKQIEKLVRNAIKEKRKLTGAEQYLINKMKKKQTEYLNRALARISAENPAAVNQIKANGLAMPSVTITEAFQYVSDLNGEHKMLHGTNAPLAWAIASLYKAMGQQAKTLVM